MAIDGRINVDVLFHDTDGTTSLKVVSLEDSTAYTTGKVAVVTGTCGTAAVTIAYAPSQYRNASGEIVSVSPLRLAFSATPAAALAMLQSDGSESSPNNATCWSFGTRPVVLEKASPQTVSTTAGTASYTLVIYGT